MQTNPPRSIEDYVLDFCHSVVPHGTPVYLPVELASHAQLNECYPAVEEMVRNQGGSICYGWQIWEWPWLMIEAEFHAVWRDPSGRLHDITPKDSAASRILFLPDPGRQYNGRQVNNIRRALIDGPEVTEFFAAADAEYEFMNRGHRAEQHGSVLLSGSAAAEWQSILLRKKAARERLAQRQPSPGRNDPCPCGSGQKFKKCHGS